MTGTDDTHFSPDAELTRAQMVTALYRYAWYSGYDVLTSLSQSLAAFPDSPMVSYWAVPAVCWAVGEGIYGETGTLTPLQTATRSDVARLVYGMLML